MKRHRRESGFAMLLVFLMAACVAITLYFEIPRVAFEAERQRELLLLDRGNQFKRAIQVFVTDKTNNPTHRYPASIDELENFNNHRYLRHKYVDPMTGKDEWRLVHINGGVLTDSVTTQVKTATGGQSGSNQPAGPDFISQQAFLDTGANGPAAGGATRALNRRPSDTAGAPGDPANPGGSPGMQGDASGGGASGAPSLAPNAPGANIPGMPGIPGAPGQNGVPGSSSNPNGQQQAPAPCNAFIGGCPTTTASGQQQGQPIPPGLPGGMPGQAGGMNGAALGGPGGAQGNGQNNAQTTAAGMINSLLTTPRPGGMPTGMPGATIGGGIAGVASKYEAEGIMVINDRTKINEWEYIFDQTKYRAPPNPLGGTAGTPQQPNGMGGNGNTPATPAGQGSSGTGTGGITTGGPGHQ
jgi:hypothetical protein